MLVTAAHRRRSLATRLLHRCIAEITAAGLVPVLDATPAGRAVYAPLGFTEAWSFTRLTAQQRAALKPDGGAVQAITDAAWPALCAYDGAARRAVRSVPGVSYDWLATGASMAYPGAVCGNPRDAASWWIIVDTDARALRWHRKDFESGEAGAFKP